MFFWICFRIDKWVNKDDRKKIDINNEIYSCNKEIKSMINILDGISHLYYNISPISDLNIIKYERKNTKNFLLILIFLNKINKNKNNSMKLLLSLKVGYV